MADESTDGYAYDIYNMRAEGATDEQISAALREKGIDITPAGVAAINDGENYLVQVKLMRYDERYAHSICSPWGVIDEKYVQWATKDQWNQILKILGVQ
jgi:hypothetical protein